MMKNVQDHSFVCKS